MPALHHQDRKTHYAACPDDLAYQYLAKLYARSNPEMRDSLEFPGGITNGAHWYPLWGGMQDWNYIMAGQQPNPANGVSLLMASLSLSLSLSLLSLSL